jgi:hypothetical protein
MVKQLGPPVNHHLQTTGYVGTLRWSSATPGSLP